MADVGTAFSGLGIKEELLDLGGEEQGLDPMGDATFPAAQNSHEESMVKSFFLSKFCLNIAVLYSVHGRL